MSISTNYPTPVLNTPDFSSCFGGKDGNSLALDDQGLMRAVETILLPGSVLDVKKQKSEHIWEIETSSYPGKNLFIDKRFLTIEPQASQISISKTPPSISKICKVLRNLQGLCYSWGGNWPTDIKEMRSFYSPIMDFSQLPLKTQETWQLKGMDCSGLLYYATHGYTPRNTSSLVNYGKTLPMENLQQREIVQKLRPLDLLVWKGHVVIVIDHEFSIESTPKEGVHMRNLSERIETILKERSPVNHYTALKPSFVICRWHPESP